MFGRQRTHQPAFLHLGLLKTATLQAVEIKFFHSGQIEKQMWKQRLI